MAGGDVAKALTVPAATLLAAAALLSTSVEPAAPAAQSALPATAAERARQLPVGWTVLSNTRLKDVCPPDGQKDWSGNPYLFSYQCRNVILAWSGAALDTRRNRLVVFGGGHGDYFGNEVYALTNIAEGLPAMLRMTDPSPINTDLNQCPEALADGKPNSRHSYGGLVYIPDADKLFVYGGSLACGSGGTSHATWLLDMATMAWQRMDPVASGGGLLPTAVYAGPMVAADYDPTTKLVVMTDYGRLWSYDPVRNQYTLLNGSVPLPTYSHGVLDPKRRLFIFMGQNTRQDGTQQVLAIDLARGGGHAVQDWSSQVTGCAGLANTNYPGLTYNASIDRIMGWPGHGNTIYLFDPDTKRCTTQTFPNGPPDVTGSGGAPLPDLKRGHNGTFGRLRYVPALDATVLVNSWLNDAYILKLGPMPGPADAATGATPGPKALTD